MQIYFNIINFPKKIFIRNQKDAFFIQKNTKVIRLSKNQWPYLQDICHSFDYYFSSVQSYKSDDYEVVDFMPLQWHEIPDYDKHPIQLPSISEPFITTKQYLDFAQLKKGDIVFDLGAYSGLTSIAFSEQVGSEGRIFALEADPLNIQCCQNNIRIHKKYGNDNIILIEKAIWSTITTLNFANDGGMGSSASIFFDKSRTINTINIQTTTLEEICKKYKLLTVDFIKCDIEGAETEIFTKNFLSKWRPKIIIEIHRIKNQLTYDSCTQLLTNFNYRCELVEQYGVDLPLLACTPN